MVELFLRSRHPSLFAPVVFYYPKVFSVSFSNLTEELNPAGEGTQHAVLLIGFGSEAGKNFWIIKNNWGKRWGMSANVKIARPSSLTGKFETMT
jgi:hypothetical protein